MEAHTAEGWKTLTEETTVGHKRIVLLPQTETEELRITVTESLAKPLISEIGLYQDSIYHE